MELGEIGSFECVLEWIASSCIECLWVECLLVFNGGGWGCIYSLQPQPSRCSLYVDRGRSAPLVRTVRPCTSTTESQRSAVTAISTAIEHLMRRQVSDKAVADGLAVHPRRFARMLKMNFTEPVTFWFFWIFNDRTVRAWWRTVRAWSRTVLASPSDGP
jgi:hypothetical protein